MKIVNRKSSYKNKFFNSIKKRTIELGFNPQFLGVEPDRTNFGNRLRWLDKAKEIDGLLSKNGLKTYAFNNGVKIEYSRKLRRSKNDFDFYRNIKNYYESNNRFASFLRGSLTFPDVSQTPTPTPTSSTPTSTPVFTSTPTSTPVFTSTPTSTPVFTSTPTFTATPTPTYYIIKNIEAEFYFDISQKSNIESNKIINTNLFLDLDLFSNLNLSKSISSELYFEKIFESKFEQKSPIKTSLNLENSFESSVAKNEFINSSFYFYVDKK